jgi:dynein heavy chain
VLGKEFTDPISYPIETIASESSNTEPIIYLLSAGADPTQAIDELAKKRKKLTMKVSMGEGQEKVALAAL